MKTVAQLRLALAALTTLAGATAWMPAQALTLVSSTANGQVLNAAVVGASAIQADVGFRSLATVAMQFEVGPADIGTFGSFNSVISLLNNHVMSTLALTLDRGEFPYVGSVTPAFSGVVSQGGDDRLQWANFAPAEVFGVDLGDPFGQPGARDWLIGFGNMVAGDRFTLTISAVPEPGVAWMLALGLPIAALVARRRRHS